MTVGKSLHPVRKSRRLARLLPTPAKGVLFMLALLLAGCNASPEQLLTRRWREAAWHYEKLDIPTGTLDARELARQHDRRIVRHESEYWEFRPDGTLLISTRSGEKLTRRWHLKGRGHVLTIQDDRGGELEVYDIKELNEQTLVLHYDIGLEVRGIAQLSFATESEHVAQLARDVRSQQPMER